MLPLADAVPRWWTEDQPHTVKGWAAVGVNAATSHASSSMGLMEPVEPQWGFDQVSRWTGLGVGTLRRLIRTGEMPAPLRGPTRGQPTRWAAEAITSWWDQVQQDKLDLGEICAMLDKSPAAIASARKRGRFPAPAGRWGQRPWWARATVEAWMAQEMPPTGVVCGAGEARRLLSSWGAGGTPLPPPDGRHGRTIWWHVPTLTRAAQLLTLEELMRTCRVSAADMGILPELPPPALENPPRWIPAAVERWRRGLFRAVTDNPDVLWGHQIGDVAGLQHDSVRRYRAAGKLPAPDGMVAGRPWWWRSTITTWNRTRTKWARTAQRAGIIPPE